jgi:hypothetical protein
VTEVCVCDSGGTIVRRIPEPHPATGAESVLAAAFAAGAPGFTCASGCAPTAAQLQELADLAVR